VKYSEIVISHVHIV